MRPALSNGNIAAFLLVGGLLNGLAARVAQSWHEDGIQSAVQFFGVSPFEIMVCCIAVHGLLRPGLVRTQAVGWAAIPFMMAILVPSSLGAWAALAAYSIWVAVCSSGEARRAALLFAGIAACAVWWALGERSVGGGLLVLDAWGAAGILSVFMDGIGRTGNVIATAAGHRIVVLIGCSTAYGLPLSMLSMYALARWNGASGTGRLLKACALLGVSYAILNLLRLVFLAVSAHWYEIGHGAGGLGAFDATATMLTVAVAWWAARGEGGQAPGPSVRTAGGKDAS